jgi:5-methyltetrahydrofolate--homocysteine methyltransferase
MERQGFTLPLLIGGATTSRLHTAVKIAPQYGHATVHVTDASRAVGVVQSLLDPARRADFGKKIKEEYGRLRESHEGRPSARPLLSLEEARARRFAPDWSRERIDRPEFLGVKVFRNFPLGELVPYVDWSPFFHAWELKGIYPKIFDDPRWGERARELFEDAQKLLKELIAGGRLRASGVIGFWPAASLGDDVELYADETRAQPIAVLHCLRQQEVKENGKPHYCLADFIAPKGSGARDYVGGFAVTAGLGADELAREFEKQHDDYNAIMVKALADRLAEAFAEALHQKAREAWGYGKGERLTSADLLAEKYRGIRPAPGYPACPDHTEKQTLFDLLDAERNVGIKLTETYAMHPAASVSGLYFAHPAAKYFDVGKIARDQVLDYQRRKALPLSELERWLTPNLAYEP